MGNKYSLFGLKHIFLSVKGIMDISYSFLNNLKKKLFAGILYPYELVMKLYIWTGFDKNGDLHLIQG